MSLPLLGTHVTAVAPSAASPTKATVTGFVEISVQEPFSDASALFLDVTRAAVQTHMYTSKHRFAPMPETLLSIKPEGSDTIIQELSAGMHRFAFTVDVPVQWTLHTATQRPAIRAHARLERKTNRRKDLVGPGVPLKPKTYVALSPEEEKRRHKEEAEDKRSKAMGRTCDVLCPIM
ncbi:hypothetical protein HDU89_008411 [Geranomyces variabilis]|nr:hypothetical protein HDU89_008411 [Geranomyces variabilis]